ncbi:MAG: metallophosphoesterase [Oscillospiraceae bacterium]|nr:metallophosphoesterase [Oscillospiraceae bacterium]
MKKKIIVIVAIVLAVALLGGGAYGALILFQPFQRDCIVGYGENIDLINRDIAPMQLRNDGTFTVLQFTDTHLVNTRGPDARTLRDIEYHTARVQPDLVVITGDLINGRAAQAYVLVDRRAALQAVIDIFARLNQPWAFVPGNNDHDNFLGSVHDVAGFLVTHCEHVIIAQQHALPGAVNFTLPLLNEQGGTVHQLVFLDSLSRHDVIAPVQAQWLDLQIDHFPSSIFLHHNTPIFTDLGLATWPSDRGNVLDELLLHENVGLVSIGHIHVAPTRQAIYANTIFQIGRVSGYRRGDSYPGGVVVTISPNTEELYQFHDFAFDWDFSYS